MALVYTISLILPTKNISSHAEQQKDLQKQSTVRRLGTAPIDLYQVKAEITGERLAFHKEKRVEIGRELNDMEKLQLDLAAEKGASAWLTSLPLKSFGYILNKQEFTKAICLWYNLKIKDTAKLCVCVCVFLVKSPR